MRYKPYMKVYLAHYSIGCAKGSILLAVSDSKEKIRYYCEIIRGLRPKEYSIRHIVLDEENMYMLYSDHILEEFDSKYLYLTNSDIEMLATDAEKEIDNIKSLISSLSSYVTKIDSIKRFRQDTDCILRTISVMSDHINSDSNLRKLGEVMLKTHPVLSPDIDEYFSYTSILTEIAENIALFYQKMEKD